AALDELFELGGGAWEPREQVGGDFGGNFVLDLVALRLADAQELLGAKTFLREIGVIGDDDVRRSRRAGTARVRDETGAAATFAEDANPAEADRLDLCDAEGLVNALPELGVAAFADVLEF